MNSVSWFLYMADILSGIQVFFGLVGTIGVLVSAFAAFAASFTYEERRKFIDVDKRGYGNYETYTEYPLKTLRPWAIVGVSLSIIFMLIAISIPSKETRFAIAASQVGEQIIQLEEVQEVGGEVGGLAKDAINLLRQNIQEQLTEKPTEAD